MSGAGLHLQRKGAEKNAPLPLHRGIEVILGRNKVCEIKDVTVSRKHASLTLSLGGKLCLTAISKVYVRSCGSASTEHVEAGASVQASSFKTVLLIQCKPCSVTMPCC